MDLPGWGDTPPPPGFDGTMGAHAEWLGSRMDELVPERFDLVVHDWGGVALVPAIARAQRVRRLVVMDCVPLLPGYTWHWLARLWRRRGVGEALLRATSRPGLGLLLRQRRGGLGPAHPELVSTIMRARRAYTDRAILALYRSADAEVLAAAGRGLERLTAEALVVWGGRDPYVDARWALRYADALGGPARVRVAPAAGHWPWFDEPALVDEVVAFLEAP